MGTDWTDLAFARLKRNKRLLFLPNDPFLQELALALGGQDRRTVILWALGLAAESVAQLEARHPGDRRPRAALDAAWLWARGRLKMPVAQRAILDCHAMAKEVTTAADAALCHAVGQACGTVHTAGHAMGYPVYELTAIVRALGLDEGRAPVEARRQAYLARLAQARAACEQDAGPWAGFLLR